MVRNKIRLLVSLTPEQVKSLKKLARKDHNPVAAHVREAVQRYLDQQQAAKEQQ
jgi:hypothetical protein